MATERIDFPKTHQFIDCANDAMHHIPSDIRSMVIQFVFDLRAVSLLKPMFQGYTLSLHGGEFLYDPLIDLEDDGKWNFHLYMCNDVDFPGRAKICLRLECDTDDMEFSNVELFLALESLWHILIDNAPNTFIPMRRKLINDIKNNILWHFERYCVIYECVRVCAARFGQLADS